MLAGAPKKPTEYFILIHETTGGGIDPFRVDYRIGPYKTYEEADDMFFVACFKIKPDYTPSGDFLFWNHEIEEVEKDDDECAQACPC